MVGNVTLIALQMAMNHKNWAVLLGKKRKKKIQRSKVLFQSLEKNVVSTATSILGSRVSYLSLDLLMCNVVCTTTFYKRKVKLINRPACFLNYSINHLTLVYINSDTFQYFILYFFLWVSWFQVSVDPNFIELNRNMSYSKQCEPYLTICFLLKLA